MGWGGLQPSKQESDTFYCRFVEHDWWQTIPQDGGALSLVGCQFGYVYHLRGVHPDGGVLDNKH
jgi:hypothetical protein